MLTKNHVGKTLNRLARTCNDSAMRFNDAVGRLENAELRRIFHEFEIRRESFAVQLRDRANRCGEDPADSGTMTETMRRAGREVKSLVLGVDDPSEVAVCATGEKATRRQFDRALPEVSREVRPLVDRMRREIARNCTLLQELQDTMRRDATEGAR